VCYICVETDVTILQLQGPSIARPKNQDIGSCVVERERERERECLVT